MCHPRPPLLTFVLILSCNYQALKKDLEGPGPLSHEYLSRWGTSRGKIIPIKRHYASLIYRIIRHNMETTFDEDVYIIPHQVRIATLKEGKIIKVTDVQIQTFSYFNVTFNNQHH